MTFYLLKRFGNGEFGALHTVCSEMSGNCYACVLALKCIGTSPLFSTMSVLQIRRGNRDILG